MEKVLRDSLYIIGDVHGCLKSLMALIDSLPNKEDSQLVFVGDLVDRGKYSAQVVEFVKNGGYDCVLGNRVLWHIGTKHDTVLNNCLKLL